jgi:hypothetical protein
MSQQNKGINIGVVILVIVIFLLISSSFNPFFLAPFGLVSRFFQSAKNLVSNGFCMMWGSGWGGSFRFFSSLLFFVIWIAILAWVYRDAEKRRMNGILWTLLVFIGNIIGLIIYLLVRNGGETHDEEKTESVETSRCPKCDKPISQDYAFCPHCTAPLKGVCPKCSHDVEPEWAACPHCGHKLI